ncbi:MAG: M15 family metallopeptidase [Proteobacteria bacterium]|jgi:hypothetical protein|nr:M15 family metallopeptidase [Pseudomonadota bacterium]
MRKRGFAALGAFSLAAIALVLAWSAFAETLPAADRSPLERLVAAYGESIGAVEGAECAATVVMADGTRISWNDGLEKSFEERLAKPDLEDMFYSPYPKGELAAPPAENADPGRVRVFDFFAAVYGGSPKAVKANLVAVPWLPSRGGKKVWFNTKNGAADALARVSAELEALPEEMMPYVVRRGGTFNWRKIAGTNRPSAHGFGIAIDIATKRADYWRWARRVNGLFVYRNRIPPEIVAAFERNGFIWGGRWYHYDTMHFEYRPELL